MPAERTAAGLGRSGPRSRTGCQNCKQARVRCDENRPKCDRCVRMKQMCDYQPPKPRQRRSQTNRPQHHQTATPSISSLSPDSAQTPREHEGYSQVLSGELATKSSPTIMTISNLPFDPLRPQSRMNQDNSSVTDSTAVPSIPEEYQMTDHHHLFSHHFPQTQSTFPFPTFEFTDVVNPIDFGYGDASAMHATTGLSPNSWSMDGSETFQAIAIRGEPEQNHGRTSFSNPTPIEESFRYTFTYPLTSAQQKMFIEYFERHIRLPASLVDVDPLGWIKVKRYLLYMAQKGTRSVSNSLFALIGLLYLLDTNPKANGSRADMKLAVSRLEEAAMAAIDSEMTCAGWEEKSNDSLLASLFLLAWFEIVSDDESRPCFPRIVAERVIVQGKKWNSGSKRLMQCFRILDSKTSHLGGRNLLTESTLEVILNEKAKISHVEDGNDSENGSGELESNAHSNGESHKNSALIPKKKARLETLLASPPPTPPPSVIKLEMFNILLQPALEFHLLSASYCRRIGSQDRHHRSRETVEDEYEVITYCRRFEEELEDLWKQRPGILNLTAEQMSAFVCKDVASRLEQLFCVYLASFWTHFIYMHRVAHWSLKHHALTTKALHETGRMMRRSVGESGDPVPFDMNVPRTFKNVIHPGLVWPCFMFGCETPDPVEQDWAVSQLKALGELENFQVSADGTPPDGLPPTRIDQKGAQNALKASVLLKVLIERQTRAQGRIDGKHLSQELFGYHFYII